MAKVNLLTQAEYAKHRGCSAVAVHKAVKAGRISLIEGKIDPVVADLQWRANTRARQMPQSGAGAASGAPGPDLVTQADGQGSADEAPAPAPASESGYSAARARREMADAEKAEMETAKLRGAMVMREDVDRAFFEQYRELRDRLAVLPKRLSGELTSLTTAEAREELIDRELRIVLELLGTSFREKMGAGPKAAA